MKKDYSPTLRQAGLKVTPARQAILRALSAGQHKPQSADRIGARLRSNKINLVTIYRTLSSLEKAGIIRHVDLNTGAMHYEPNDDHHHHLVCTGCGLVEDFDMCGIQKMAQKVLKCSGFKSVNAHSLELFGICKRCSAAKR